VKTKRGGTLIHKNNKIYKKMKKKMKQMLAKAMKRKNKKKTIKSKKKSVKKKKMNVWYKLIQKFKNGYEYVTDLDNIIILFVKMWAVALAFIVLLFSMEYILYIFYTPSPTSSPAFNPYKFPSCFVYIHIILCCCFIIKKYLGTKKYRILSIIVVFSLLMMFSFYDPHFMGRLFMILSFVCLDYGRAKFFEWEEYNHPPWRSWKPREIEYPAWLSWLIR